jgi:YidC/Oxa1 family membrane protein insertase
MDNRTLLAIVLCLAVIIAWQYLFVQPPPQQPQTVKQAPPVGQKQATVKPVIPPSAVQPAAPVDTVMHEEEFTIDNELYSAVLTSRGASIKHWEIKNHKDKEGSNVALLKNPGSLPALAIGSNKNFDLARVNYRVSGRSLVLDRDNPSGSLVFEYSGEGFSVRRTYTFYADTYKVDLTDEVSGLPEYWISLGSDFGIFDNSASYTHVGPVLLTGTDLEELKPKKLKTEPAVFRENLQWIAQEDKYFFSGLVPLTEVEQARAWSFEDSPVIAFKGNTETNKFMLFAGPKEHERLKQVGGGLEHIINFGFFSIIARPLFWLMIFLYKHVGNYGWAIVLLTIITRVPFIPLVNKGQKSMKKLQKIQPLMAEVKEKYKKDPQKMQKEMSELYKKHKVNPLGGCLPMLVQLPVFFALYKVLLVAIELRGAPFIFWITDLSAKDPYFILPIVMGATMLLQQKMTPSGMDPKQAKMMLMMPIVFTFLFLTFASGLVLYWLVNNILGIGQQLLVNRKAAKEPAS